MRYFEFFAFAFKIRVKKNQRLCRFATGVAGTTLREGNEWKGRKAQRGWRDFDPSLIPGFPPPYFRMRFKFTKIFFGNFFHDARENMLESLDFQFFFSRHRGIKARWNSNDSTVERVQFDNSIIFIFRILNFLRESSCRRILKIIVLR